MFWFKKKVRKLSEDAEAVQAICELPLEEWKWRPSGVSLFKISASDALYSYRECRGSWDHPKGFSVYPSANFCMYMITHRNMKKSYFVHRGEQGFRMMNDRDIDLYNLHLKPREVEVKAKEKTLATVDNHEQFMNLFKEN